MSLSQFQTEITPALLVPDSGVLGSMNKHPSFSGTKDSSQDPRLPALTQSWADREELVTLGLCEN